MERPAEFELVAIGIYNGVDIDDNDTIILDGSYIVYIQVPNPEYDCEVIICTQKK